MMKILLSPAICLSFFLTFAFSGVTFAQTDDIILRNNNVVQGKVDEVGVDVVRYHKADNLDGPVYDMPKSDIYMIVYANGTRDVINPQNGDSPPPASDAPAANAPVTEAPPEMPVYEQPYCPVQGYMWTPGYWAWGFLGYYWVPGVWISPPQPGYLWTPGYWGFAGGFYGWHEGYWGEHIGFYGGVNYGYGYGGSGYYGGRWEGGAFQYNTAVTRVDVTVVHTTYVNNTVVNNTVVNHASFNGQGGVVANPTPQEKMAMNERHINPTPVQVSHVATARSDKSQYVSENHGKPTVTAMNKPGGKAFSSEGHEATPHPNSVPANAHPANTQHTPTGLEHSQSATQHDVPAPQHNEPATQHNQPAPEHNQPASQQHSQPAPQQHTTQTTTQQTRQTTNKPAPKPAPKPKPAPRPAPPRNEEHH